MFIMCYLRRCPTRLLNYSLVEPLRYTSLSKSMSSHKSYINLNDQMSRKHCHPAAERNKQPILEALQKYIDPQKKGTLLEISSGSGQHVAHVSQKFPNISFQPTEYEHTSLASIKVYVDQDCSNNVKQPKYLNVKDSPKTWLESSLEKGTIDYMLNVNMMHISDWGCSEGLFQGADYYLKSEGILFTYGPYAVDGVITPESNVHFDKCLRSQNNTWGLRDIERELKPLAAKNGLQLMATHDLPANNKFLVWTRK